MPVAQLQHCQHSALFPLAIFCLLSLKLCPFTYTYLNFFFCLFHQAILYTFKNYSNWGHFRLLCFPRKHCFLNWFREFTVRDSHVRRPLLLRDIYFGESYLIFRHKWLDSKCGKEKFAMGPFLTPWSNERRWWNTGLLSHSSHQVVL